MRLVLDTHVLVSGLLFPGGPSSRLVKAWRTGGFDPAISDFVSDELPRTWEHLAPRLKSSEFPRNPAIHGGEVEGQPARAAYGAEDARCAST